MSNYRASLSLENVPIPVGLFTPQWWRSHSPITLPLVPRPDESYGSFVVRLRSYKWRELGGGGL
jgi:hypothetical protein